MQLEELWSNFVRNLEYYLPSMTYEWTRAWIMAHVKHIERFMIILHFKENGELAGIVPLYLYVKRMGRLSVRVLDLIGGRDPSLVSFIVSVEHSIALILRTLKIIQMTCDDYDIITFRRIGQAAASSIRLEQVISKLKIRYHSESIVRIPHIRLTGDFDHFLNSRSKHFRKEFRRKSRNLSRDFGTDIVYDVVKDSRILNALDEFVDLEKKGWKGQQKSALYFRKHLMASYKNLLTGPKSNLEPMIFQLKVNGMLVSSSIAIKTQKSLYIHRIAYDEHFSKYSPGILLRLYEVECAYLDDLKTYNFAGAATKWMRDFTKDGYYSLDYCIYNKSAKALLAYFFKGKAVPFLKKYLHKLPIRDAVPTR